MASNPLYVSAAVLSNKILCGFPQNTRGTMPDTKASQIDNPHVDVVRSLTRSSLVEMFSHSLGGDTDIDDFVHSSQLKYIDQVARAPCASIITYRYCLRTRFVKSNSSQHCTRFPLGQRRSRNFFVLWDFRPLPLNYGVLLEGQTLSRQNASGNLVSAAYRSAPIDVQGCMHIQGMVAALSLDTKHACTTALTKMFNSVGEMQNEFSKDGT